MIETTNDWHEPYEPETATNEQLADDWRLFVAAIANLDAGKTEPFSYNDIYRLATACIREIAKRVRANKMNFSVSIQAEAERSKAYRKLWQHVILKLKAWEIATVTDSLELELESSFIRKDSENKEELAPVNPSGIELGEAITLEDVLGYFKSFYRTRPYVSLIGGLCTQHKTKGDIDIFIRSTHRDIATEFRIIRMFPRELWHRFQFRYPYQEDTHPGIFTNYVNLYDEKLELRTAKELVLMSSSSTTDADDDTETEPKPLKLFEFAQLLKPTHGHYKGEEYAIDKLIEVVNARPEWYEKGIYVQKKFDGVHVRVDHSEDGNVIIYSEEGNEITKNLPSLAAEVATVCNGHDVILTGELECWKDQTHQPRQHTTAIIHTKDVHPDEKHVFLNLFDCLYYDRDRHTEPYFKRLQCLKKVRDTEHLKRAGFMLVKSEADLRKSVEYYANLPGSEGAYLKRADFPYELDGKTRLNIKYKNTFAIDTRVIAIHEVKGNANTYNYLCVIEDDRGNEIPIGRTYNTTIQLKKGDIVKVEFVTLSQYTDPETGRIWFNWWSPHVIMARPDKDKPDTVSTAKKLVEASHGTKTEKLWPRRYRQTEDADPYLTYPDESKHWKGMVHCHGRGKSVHLDFRCQISSDYAVGWTLYVPRGLSKTPESFVEFKTLVDREIMPLIKETLNNPQKKFNCNKKAPEPIEWLSYSGMVQPGHIGATKNEPGFFYIIDAFEVQFGTQKPHFHEYFCYGSLFNGRLVFRLLENKAEWKRTGEGLMIWMMFRALRSPMPYVFSNRAIQKRWVPPYNVSGLPRNIRVKIPERFRYWIFEDTAKRRAVRDQLVTEIKKRLESKRRVDRCSTG